MDTLITIDALNIRSAGNTSACVIAVLPVNTTIQTWNDDGKSLWVYASTVLNGLPVAGWVYRKYTTAPGGKALTPDPGVTPPHNTHPLDGEGKKHKIGIHVIPGGSRDAIVGMAKRLTDAGKPLVSATVVNDATLANALAPLVKYVILRLGVGSGADNVSPQLPYVADYKAIAAAKLQGWNLASVDSRVYLQPYNELTPSAFHDLVWMGVMKACEAVGRKAAIGAYAVGNGDTGFWASLTNSLRYAKANGHVLAMHGYAPPPGDSMYAGPARLSRDTGDWELRAIRLAESVPIEARPTLVFSEFGNDFSGKNFQGATNFVAFMTAGSSAIQGYPYAASVNGWTFGNEGQFSGACADSAMGPLEQAIAGGAGL
jgi:hypothetical protein